MELKITPSIKNVDTLKAPFFKDNKLLYNDSCPVSGQHEVGDIVISNTQADDIIGWICIEAGDPGVWSTIESGSKGKLRFYDNIVQFSDTRSSIAIGIDNFNKNRDILNVHYNGLLLLEGTHYTISEDSKNIVAIDESWNISAEAGHEMIFKVINLVDTLDSEQIMKKIKNTVTISSEASEVVIGIDGFDKETQVLTVYKNSTYLTEGVDYEISADSSKIVCLNGSWNKDNVADYSFTFEVLKNVSVYKADEGSVGMEHLKNDVKEAIENASNIDLSGYATKEELNNIDMSGKQDKTDNSLSTENKTIVGAINEIYSEINSVRSNMVDTINDISDNL